MSLDSEKMFLAIMENPTPERIGNSCMEENSQPAPAATSIRQPLALEQKKKEKESNGGKKRQLSAVAYDDGDETTRSGGGTNSLQHGSCNPSTTKRVRRDDGDVLIEEEEEEHVSLAQQPESLSSKTPATNKYCSDEVSLSSSSIVDSKSNNNNKKKERSPQKHVSVAQQQESPSSKPPTTKKCCSDEVSMSSSSIVDSKSNNNKINGTSSNNPLGFCYHDTATPITIRNNDGSNDGGSYSNNKINSTSNNNPESSAPKDNNNNSDGGFASSTKLRSNKENQNQEQSNDKCISSTGNHLDRSNCSKTMALSTRQHLKPPSIKNSRDGIPSSPLSTPAMPDHVYNMSPNGPHLAVDKPTANNETKKKKKKKKREKPLPPSPVHKRLVSQSKHPYIQLIDNADENNTCIPDSIAMIINQLTENQSTISYDEARKSIPACMFGSFLSQKGFRDMNDLSDINQLLNHYNYFIEKHPNFGQGDSMVLFSKKKGTFVARIGFFEMSENSRRQPKPWNTHMAVFFAEEGWFADTHNVMDFSAALTNRLAQKMMKEKWNPNKKYKLLNIWEIKKV